jgi:hypothetical protein
METEPIDQPVSDDNAELHARRIDMGDGRYLIFFTFGDTAELDQRLEKNV